MIDEVERHLAMVFHRYLDAGDLCLTINGRDVSAWDPFLRDHPATWSSPIERIHSPAGLLEVQCHVLPHKDHLTLKQEKSTAGPHGWTAQQGSTSIATGAFYSLAAGSVSVREDRGQGGGPPAGKFGSTYRIPPTRDWKIDIRKSAASPPVSLRGLLTRLAEEDARESAKKSSRTGGSQSRLPGARPVAQAWRTGRSTSGLRYRIDHEHTAVRAVLDDAGSLAPRIKAMLRLRDRGDGACAAHLARYHRGDRRRPLVLGSAASQVLN